MATASQNEGRGRSRLVAPAMLAVLAASVATALWLVKAGASPAAAQGADIVAEIRRRGLGEFWKSPSTRWFLVRQGRRVAGCAAVARAPREDGGFDGVNLRLASGERGATSGNWERWTLNANATAGRYDAGSVRLGPDGILAPADTVIRLSRGRITVQQFRQEGMFQSSKAAPDNYLAEGTTDLAMTLVARRKTQAHFKLVFNELPPIGQTTRLGVVEMECLDVSGVEMRVAVRYVGLGRDSQTIHALDENGDAVRTIYDNGEQTAASEQEVLSAFPQAGEVLQWLMRSRVAESVVEGTLVYRGDAAGRR